MTYINLRLSEHISQEIQVGTVYGVGLNYARHIDEMNSEKPDEPVVFLKPASALLPGGGEMIYPSITQNLHHELELVVLLGQDLYQANADHARQAIMGCAIGLDLTLRDRQSEAKAKGHPWSVAKGFAGSAPVSTFLPTDRFDNIQNLDLCLSVNGNLRQKGNTREMLFSVIDLMVYLSSVFQLKRGDLIFTGTPDGVGTLNLGDRVEALLADLLSLQINIV